jgi:L-fuconolactonase
MTHGEIRFNRAPARRGWRGRHATLTDYSLGLAPAGPGRIGAHVHLWQLSVRDQPCTARLPSLRHDCTLDELQHWLAAAVVRAAVLVQTAPVAAETPEMLAIADAADEIAGVVRWVDLCAADVAGRLASLTEGSGGCWLTGIRHGVQDEHDPDWLLRPEALRGRQAIAGAGLVYDILVRSDQMLMAGRVARRRPGLRFVLGHGGKPPIASGAMDPWRQHVDELARCPNVAVKLPGLLTEAGPGVDARTLRPYSDHLLGAFGPGRTMFASDWPVSTLRAGHSREVGLSAERLGGLSSHGQATVFGATAAAWYGFGATDHDRAGRPCG